jgi:predicted N-formylglutamate amidohydrolase
MSEQFEGILASDDPPVFTVGNEKGASPFLIVSDHAGKQMPRRLAQLGLSNAECDRHIAWDIGAGALADMIAGALDAVVIRQNYSRLVIDCNRMPWSETSILEVSEMTRVPGNVDLSEHHRRARLHEIFHPYHNRIADELDERREAGRPTILISVHSFTPVFKARERPWHVGVLYNRDARLAHILLEMLQREDGLSVGDNEPYSVSDASDYTIPVHGERRAVPHVALEIRQDLVTDVAGQRKWAELLLRLLPQAGEQLNG